MAARRWYSQVLIVAVVVISAGAAFSIPSIRGWHIWGPLAKRQAPVAAKPAAKPRVVAQPQATPVQPTVNSGEVSVAEKAPVKRRRSLRRNGLRQSASVFVTPSTSRGRTIVRPTRSRRSRPGTQSIRATRKYFESWRACWPAARAPTTPSRATASCWPFRRVLATRFEYAAALLALQQYDSAAANYRILIAADSVSMSAHLGLARALAWSNHSREAEPELRWLVALTPDDTLLVSMLHVARNAYDPPASEAVDMAGRGTDGSRRIGLHSRGRTFASGIRSFRSRISTRSSPPAPTAPLSLVREAASAHAAAGDSVGTARMMRRAVALAPSDPALRQSYAEVLSWSGDRAAAIAQYDTLLAAACRC